MVERRLSPRSRRELAEIRHARHRPARGRAAARLRRLCPGDPDDDATYDELGASLTSIERERGTRAIGCSISRRRLRLSPRSCCQLGKSGLARRRQRRLAPRRHREAVRHRSRLGAGAQSDTARHPRRESDLSASIIISARRRCRTSWCCASPTACSSRSGTATISTRADHRRRNRSASSGAASYL